MEDEAIEKMLRDRPQLLRDAADRADAYLVTLGDRRVSPAREAIEGLAAFDAALPGRGLAADKVLADSTRLDQLQPSRWPDRDFLDSSTAARCR